MTRLKRILNRVHAILTTGKSVAAIVGTAATAGGAAIATVNNAPGWLVGVLLTVGTLATGFAAWEIPYKPFPEEEG